MLNRDHVRTIYPPRRTGFGREAEGRRVFTAMFVHFAVMKACCFVIFVYI